MNSIWGKKLFAKLYKGITKKKPEIDIHRWKIVKGDLVEVIEGPQKGQRGKVVSVIRQKNRILIDGVNMVRICRSSLYWSISFRFSNVETKNYEITNPFYA